MFCGVSVAKATGFLRRSRSKPEARSPKPLEALGGLGNAIIDTGAVSRLHDASIAHVLLWLRTTFEVRTVQGDHRAARLAAGRAVSRSGSLGEHDGRQVQGSWLWGRSLLRATADRTTTYVAF